MSSINCPCETTLLLIIVRSLPEQKCSQYASLIWRCFSSAVLIGAALPLLNFLILMNTFTLRFIYCLFIPLGASVCLLLTHPQWDAIIARGATVFLSMLLKDTSGIEPQSFYSVEEHTYHLTHSCPDICMYCRWMSITTIYNNIISCYYYKLE